MLRTENVALIHAHFGPGGLEMLALSRSLGIPLLVTFHGYDASRLLRNERYRRSLSRLFARAHVITVSERMRTQLLAHGADPSRTRVHYIGAPVEDFAFRWSCASHQSHSFKGIPYLFRAGLWPLIVDPDARLEYPDQEYPALKLIRKWGGKIVEKYARGIQKRGNFARRVEPRPPEIMYADAPGKVTGSVRLGDQYNKS